MAVSEEMLAGVEDGLVDHDIGVGHGIRRRTLNVEV
jgi:hypothetical protein